MDSVTRIKEHTRRDGSKFYTAHRTLFGFIPAYWGGYIQDGWCIPGLSWICFRAEYKTAAGLETAIRRRDAEARLVAEEKRAKQVVRVRLDTTF